MIVNPVYRWQTIPKGSIIIVRAEFAACPTVEGFAYRYKAPKFEVTKIPFADFTMGCHCLIFVKGVNTTANELFTIAEKMGGKKVVLMSVGGTFLHKAGFDVSEFANENKDELSKLPPGIDWLMERDPDDTGIPDRLLGVIIVVGIVGLIMGAVGVYLRYGRGGK